MRRSERWVEKSVGCEDASDVMVLKNLGSSAMGKAGRVPRMEFMRDTACD